MKAKNVEILERERERESYILVNSVALVFVRKIQIYYVKYRTCHLNLMRSFCELFSKNFTSGYI